MNKTKSALILLTPDQYKQLQWLKQKLPELIPGLQVSNSEIMRIALTQLYAKYAEKKARK